MKDARSLNTGYQSSHKCIGLNSQIIKSTGKLYTLTLHSPNIHPYFIFCWFGLRCTQYSAKLLSNVRFSLLCLRVKIINIKYKLPSKGFPSSTAFEFPQSSLKHQLSSSREKILIHHVTVVLHIQKVQQQRVHLIFYLLTDQQSISPFNKRSDDGARKLRSYIQLKLFSSAPHTTWRTGDLFSFLDYPDRRRGQHLWLDSYR